MWPSRGSFVCLHSGSSADVWEAAPPLAWLCNTLLPRAIRAWRRWPIALPIFCNRQMRRPPATVDCAPPRRHCQTHCTYGQLSETDTLDRDREGTVINEPRRPVRGSEIANLG